MDNRKYNGEIGLTDKRIHEKDKKNKNIVCNTRINKNKARKPTEIN